MAEYKGSTKNTSYDLKLDEVTVEALIAIISFAGNTAAHFASRGISSDFTSEDMLKLARIVNDSKDILQYIKASIAIGTPIDGILH